MAEQEKSVKLGEVIREFNLEILRTAPDYENVPLRALDINRPGLPLTGFFEHFDTERLLLIGLTEHTFLRDLTPEERRERFDKLMSYPVPALILTRGLDLPEQLIQQIGPSNYPLRRYAGDLRRGRADPRRVRRGQKRGSH